MAESEAAESYESPPDTPPAIPEATGKPEEPPGSEQPECPPPPPETSGCEPGVDDLKCRAAGDKAKATYHDTFEQDLADAKTSYEKARKEFRTEHHDAATVVQDLENQIRHLVERIKCQIEQKRVWRCLDDAFCAVLEELKCCPTPAPCCTEECEFPLDDIEKKTAAELAMLITEYQKRVDDAKKCFTDLLGEPAKLKHTVEEMKAEVASITADLAGDQAKLDLKKLYARALVAQWKIKRIWGGFSQVQKFVDCLCQALICWTKGCQAVYELHGAKAVATCLEDTKTKRCDRLRDETVEEVLAAYDRLCGKLPCDDESTEEEEEHDKHDDEDDCDCDCDCEECQETEEPDDYGCHHHHHGCDCHQHHRHHHHRHHHRRSRCRDCG